MQVGSSSSVAWLPQDRSLVVVLSWEPRGLVAIETPRQPYHGRLQVRSLTGIDEELEEIAFDVQGGLLSLAAISKPVDDLGS